MLGKSVPDPEAMRLLVDRIAASKLFAHAPQRVQFLRFTVEETICGRGAALKEYCIGVQAFGRSADFDPKIDTSVRVQAGRVRAKLKEYFESEGASEPIVIDYPLGSYIPDFHLRDNAPGPTLAPSRASRRVWLSIGIGSAVLVLALGVRAARTWGESAPVKTAQLTFDNGFTADPSVSRDGKLMAYSSDRAEYGNPDIWVQPMDGSRPAHRLTIDAAHDLAPDISPDGSAIAFQSNAAGGGIYLVAAAGGEPRRLTSFGVCPRFSPDGLWIAFWGRTDQGRTAAFVVPVGGGDVIDVRPDSPHSAFPIWSPSGRQILTVSATDSDESNYDWWVTPVALPVVPRVGSSIRTNAATVLSASGFGVIDSLRPALAWHDEVIVFGHSSQFWRLPISAGSFQAAGRPRQMLHGPAVAAWARLARGGDRLNVHFTSGGRLNHIWALSASNATTQLTNDASLLPGRGVRFALSSDGSRLLFSSGRTGTWRIWERDLATGQEVPVTSGGSDWDPLLSPSASRFAFVREEQGTRSLWVYTSGIERRIARDCERPVAWLPGEAAILCLADKSIWSVELANGSRKRLFSRDNWMLIEAALSPDGKWLALVADPGDNHQYAYLVCMESSGLADPANWIPISKDRFNLTLTWSPDGYELYYFCSRDGSRCLWSQRIAELIQGRPAPPPRALRHFHAYQDYPLNGSHIAAAGDRIAVMLAQHRYNIWQASIPDSR
jgi:eukaryotic-like serine/threonine-protein kinase